MADEETQKKWRNLVHEYFAGCTNADPARIAATCADDAVIYDTTLQPMRGKQTIGKLAAAATKKFGGVGGWSVDRMVVDKDGLGIEWSLQGKLKTATFALRGAEHYSFVEDPKNKGSPLISQIRQYPSTTWDNIGKRDSLGLMDFNYAENGITRPRSLALSPDSGVSDAVERRRKLVYDYFAACTTGSAEGVGSCFSTDAVIYDTNHPPVKGCEAIGNFWNKIHAKWKGAVWIIDRMVADRDELGIEWTMSGTSPATGPFAVRGAEHYAFAGSPEKPLISEIRQYWIFDQKNPGSQLIGFDYENDPRGPWAKAPESSGQQNSESKSRL